MKAVLTALKTIEFRKEEAATTGEEGYPFLNVICCAVCRTDAKMWEQGHRDLVFPRVPGHEMVVEDELKNRYAVWPGKSCGNCVYCRTGRENLCEDIRITGFHSDGGFSGRVQVPRDSLIPLPRSMSNTAASFAEPVGCVIHAMEKLHLEKNNRLLIYGGGTVGLLTALYARDRGYLPLVMEKSSEKINRCAGFLGRTGIQCVKETNESEFRGVINACADYIAFSQAITKTARGGSISFFSGLTKNEYVESNLLNLLHYKEICLSGAYGLTKKDMEKAIPFIEKYGEEIELLVEEIAPLDEIPDIMKKVLSGEYFKFIIDVSGELSGRGDSLPGKELQGETLHREKSAGTPLPGENSLWEPVIQGILPVDDSFRFGAEKKIDGKTKPLGALGRLEELAVRMSVIQQSLNPRIEKKSLFVFAGDHGITEEGVSAYPSEVTGQMVENFLNGGAAINVLCRHNGIELKVVDMGVNRDFPNHPDLVKKKVRKGTRNFAREKAMTSDEMIQALENGMEIFLESTENEKIDIVGLGEMGIGNTTSASAIISAVTGISPRESAGRGTGIDDKGLEHKAKVIKRALDFHKPDPGNGFDILQRLGGFEIAGMAGMALAAAGKKSAVVLDGLISTAAGLIAFLINPGIKGYLFSAHKSVEGGQAAALSFMGLEPLVDLQMRLGEGTGAALAMNMADASCRIMREMASFEEARVSGSLKEQILPSGD